MGVLNDALIQYKLYEPAALWDLSLSAGDVCCLYINIYGSGLWKKWMFK